MDMKDYFENTKGVGVLATADADGKVNAAIYARPHFLEDNNNDTVSFIMNERLCMPTSWRIRTQPTSSSKRAANT